MEISNVTNSSKEHLEDFEEFDLRDAVNVAAYSLMSASKSLLLYFHQQYCNFQAFLYHINFICFIFLIDLYVVHKIIFFFYENV